MKGTLLDRYFGTRVRSPLGRLRLPRLLMRMDTIIMEGLEMR